MLFHEFLQRDVVIAKHYEGVPGSQYEHDIFGPGRVIGADFISSTFVYCDLFILVNLYTRIVQMRMEAWV